MNVNIKRFDPTQPLPVATENAACFDLFCRETVTIPAGKMWAIAQNVAIKVPDGHALLLFSRSSTPIRTGLMLTNGVGVIDPFYCGDNDEILSFFLNTTDEPVTVAKGDRIVQGMFIKPQPITWNEVDNMSDPGVGGYRHKEHLEA